jgi:hypothetical protein
METFKGIILFRGKGYKLNPQGECVPPSVEDTGNLMFEIKANTKNELKQKIENLKENIKQWLQQNQTE